MKRNQKQDKASDVRELSADKSHSPQRRSRRRFLGEVGGIAAMGLAAGSIGIEPLLGSKRAIVQAAEITPEGDQQRLNDSFQVRLQADVNEKNLGTFPHPTNGDEELYPNRIGNFHKTLPHDSTTGEVDPAAYNALLHALSTGSF